jgi:hypothetical protein
MIPMDVGCVTLKGGDVGHVLSLNDMYINKRKNKREKKNNN